MPYTTSQCRLFGAMEGRGEKVPADWQSKCTAAMQAKANKKTRATHRAKRTKGRK